MHIIGTNITDEKALLDVSVHTRGTIEDKENIVLFLNIVEEQLWIELVEQLIVCDLLWFGILDNPSLVPFYTGNPLINFLQDWYIEDPVAQKLLLSSRFISRPSIVASENLIVPNKSTDSSPDPDRPLHSIDEFCINENLLATTNTHLIYFLDEKGRIGRKKAIITYRIKIGYLEESC